MSIKGEINRIKITKYNICDSIRSKGVDVPEEIPLNQVPLYIEKIPTGNSNLSDIFDALYPVGTIMMYQDGTDLDAYFQNIIPGCAWERCLLGRSPIGYTSSDSDFSQTGRQLGEKAHTLTVDEMPKHSHRFHQGGSTLGVKYTGATSFADNGWDGSYIENTGGNQPHNNLHPVEVIAFWKRVK